MVKFRTRDQIGLVAALHARYGIGPFTAADAILDLGLPDHHRVGPVVRYMVNNGLLSSSPGENRRNGQPRPIYTVTAKAIVAIKRDTGERVPICVEKSERGLRSSVKHFFENQCAHCSAPNLAGHYRFVTMLSGPTIPLCNICAKRVAAGDPTYWETCLNNLIATKYGGQWRLDGMDAIEKCDRVPSTG